MNKHFSPQSSPLANEDPVHGDGAAERVLACGRDLPLACATPPRGWPMFLTQRQFPIHVVVGRSPSAWAAGCSEPGPIGRNWCSRSRRLLVLELDQHGDRVGGGSGPSAAASCPGPDRQGLRRSGAVLVAAVLAVIALLLLAGPLLFVLGL